MEARRYVVIRAHTTEYPEPITFSEGALLTVGERYDGPEGWEDWYYCESPGRKGGWVPVQVLDFVDESRARAREGYTARELNVREGMTVAGSRSLNGWIWCTDPESGDSGWVPEAHLRAL